ncbi:hypothetical protein [Fredinandcohnia onubensis]|uniref:hypothetical protein n=1 Tax=Fredinandcohnia onubensis TaxID=1571209 RepID=UPI000C0C05B6|nr:hypothetical protein [Fredinandcohnia onubensis]
MGQGKKKGKKSHKKQFWGLAKEVRLEKGKEWVAHYEGDDIIKGYSKTFGLNLINSMKELKRIGVPISSQDRKRIEDLIEEGKRKKELRREKRRNALGLNEFKDYDETFSFIAGYTPGGAPYGMTHEEMEKRTKEE